MLRKTASDCRSHTGPLTDLRSRDHTCSGFAVGLLTVFLALSLPVCAAPGDPVEGKPRSITVRIQGQGIPPYLRPPVLPFRPQQSPGQPGNPSQGGDSKASHELPARPEPVVVKATRKPGAVAAKPKPAGPLPLRPFREMTPAERATYDLVALLSNREEKDPKVVLTQVRKAIEAGANPNATAMDGVTPLVWALFDYQDGKAFDIDLVRLLVKKGANPDEVIRVFGSGRPLMKAAANGWLDGVRALLDAPRGLMLDAVDAKERTALHHAVRNGSLPIVQALITAGSPLSMADEDGQTPLHYAAYAGKDDLVRALLEAGSDDTLKNSEGKSALFLALAQGHAGAAALLGASKNAPLDEIDDQGETALHRAARKGDLSVVEALLKNYEAHYRKVDEKSKALNTPLYLAAEAGHLDIVRALLKAGASVFERGQNNMRPYDVARMNEQEAVADFLREPTGEK